jgi:hypothetical protein
MVVVRNRFLRSSSWRSSALSVIGHRVVWCALQVRPLNVSWSTVLTELFTPVGFCASLTGGAKAYLRAGAEQVGPEVMLPLDEAAGLG